MRRALPLSLGAVVASFGVAEARRPDLSAIPAGPVPVASTDGFAVANTGAIASVDLSGRWDFTPVQPSGPTSSITVPGGGWIKQGFTGVSEAIYSRQVTVPDTGGAQTVMLELGAVNHQATLTIDGRTVGTTTTSYMPASFDLTPFVRPGGTHTISIRIKGREALKKDDKYLVAEGAEWSDTVPQGIYRSAYLRVYPQAYVASAFVRTSVADRTVSYDLKLRNTGAAPRKVTLSGLITSATGDAFRYSAIADTVVTVPAYATVTRTIGPLPWAGGPESYWWPNLPYRSGYRARLHLLTVGLTGDRGARQTVRTRFGFREFTQPPGQTKYYLNGVPVNLRGDNIQVADYDRVDRNGRSDAVDFLPGFLPPSPGNPGWPQAVDNYQRLNFNVVRLHQSPVSPYMIDVLDEMGMMAIGESAIRGSAGREHFIAGRDNMVSHVRDMVLQNRNHPSIVE